MNNLHYYVFLIGYVRVVFSFASFYYMPYEPGKAVFFYVLSQLMDAFDGYAARRFNQCEKMALI